MRHRWLAAAAALAAALLTPPLAAADTTTSVGPLSTSAWTDLGTGPKFVYPLAGAGASYQIADTQPSAASAGVPLPEAGKDLQTSSHIWALAARGPATTLLVAPITSWGVGSGGSVTIGGTLPAFASTPTVNVGTMPSVAVTGAFWQTTQPVSLASLPALAPGSSTIGKVDQGAANATPWNSNIAQIGGATISTGSGSVDSGTQRVVLAAGGPTATAANQTAVQSTVAPGSAPSNASVVGGVYTATAPSPSDGQTMAVRLDASGNLRTAQPLGAPTWWPATYSSIASNSVTTVAARATRSVVTIYNPGTADLCMTTSSSATSCTGSYTRVRPGYAKTLNTTAAIYLISASGTGSAEVDETGF